MTGLTQYVSINDSGVGQDTADFFTQVIEFMVNFVYTIVKFVIDLVTQPEIAGPLIAVVLLYMAYKRRASKRMM